MPLRPENNPRLPDPEDDLADEAPEGRDIVVITAPTPDGPPPARQLTPEDYEPPKSTDFDFPKNSPSGRLPALNLENPLPLNILSERMQSRVLGWEPDVIRVVNHETGIFTDLPMICAGTEGCKYGKICPVINRDDFIGRSCPLEVREVFKNFAGYVRDLGIAPTNFIDLKQVAQLCRHQVTMWRCDMSMKMEPEVGEEVAVVAQKTGDVYMRPVINKHRDLQTLTEEKILKIYRELIATRDARRRSTKDASAEANMSVLMSRISGLSTRRDKD
jgi:hypothetical protein